MAESMLPSDDLVEDVEMVEQQRKYGFDDKFKCPQFDYVFFYWDKDVDNAKTFHEDFQKTFGLKGCLYNDGVFFHWVGDEMQRANVACEYSTFILIYVTPNLCKVFDIFSQNENDVFKHVKYAALYKSLTDKDKYDCFVPIFLQPKSKYEKLPFSIAPLAGLVTTSRFYEDNVAALFGLTKTENNTYVPNTDSTPQLKKKQREKRVEVEKKKYEEENKKKCDNMDEQSLPYLLDQLQLSGGGYTVHVAEKKITTNRNRETISGDGHHTGTLNEQPSSAQFTQSSDSTIHEASATAYVPEQPNGSPLTGLRNATSPVSSNSQKNDNHGSSRTCKLKVQQVSPLNNTHFELEQAAFCEQKSDTSKMLPSGAKTPEAQSKGPSPIDHKPLAVDCQFEQGDEMGIQAASTDILTHPNAMESTHQNVSRPRVQENRQMAEKENEHDALHQQAIEQEADYQLGRHVSPPNNTDFELELAAFCEHKSDTSRMIPSGAKTPEAQSKGPSPIDHKPLAADCQFEQGVEMGIQAASTDILRHPNAMESTHQNVSRPRVQENHQMAEMEEEKKKKKTDNYDVRVNTEQPLDSSFVTVNESCEGSDTEETEQFIPTLDILLRKKETEHDALHQQANEQEAECQMGWSNANIDQRHSEKSRDAQQGQRFSAEVGRPASAEKEEAGKSKLNAASSDGHMMVNQGEALSTKNQNDALIFERLRIQDEALKQLERKITHQWSLETKEMPCYKMDRIPRGYCLIINNEHFSGAENEDKMSQRFSTDVDAGLLSKTFTSLGFKVIIEKDLSSQQMHCWLADFALKKSHKNFDCFACCILSHGKMGQVYGTNQKPVEIKALTGYFRPSSCPSLKGKPKLFFIQACQGTERQHVYEDIQTDDQPGAKPRTLPNEADFLIGYATVPGYVSYRSKTKGSWYITVLTKMLNRYSGKHDLLSILTTVNEEISQGNVELSDGKDYGQVPAPIHTLRRKIFLSQAV